MFDSDLDNMFTETRLTSLPEVRLTSDLSRLRKENAWNRLDAEGDHDAVGIIKCSWGFGRGGGGGHWWFTHVTDTALTLALKLT